MKIPRQISLKKATTIILISVLLTVIGSYYAFAATPTSTFTISPGIYPGAPSYTIWKEGNTYFAKNSNGKIEFSGTNASQVIQAALDALPNGGKIHISQGDYYLSSPIWIKYDGIVLTGESVGSDSGYGTILRASTSLNDFIFKIQSTDGSILQRITIRDLFIHGGRSSSYTNDGILINKTMEIHMENVIIQGFIGYGMALYQVWQGVFVDVRIYSCGDASTEKPMLLIHYGTTDNSNELDFIGCRIGICYYDAVHIIGSPDNGDTTWNRQISFVGGILYHSAGESDYRCFMINYSRYIYFTDVMLGGKNNLIANSRMIFFTTCRFETGTLSSDEYLVILHGDATGNTQGILFNGVGFWTNDEGNAIKFSGVAYGVRDVHAKGCYIYKPSFAVEPYTGLEHYWKENSVSNGDWVAHGLIWKPNIVLLTPTEETFVWVMGWNATHIQIGVNGTATPDVYIYAACTEYSG